MFRLIFVILFKQPPQGLFSRKCPMHNPQFMPHGAINPLYLNAVVVITYPMNLAPANPIPAPRIIEKTVMGINDFLSFG